MPFTITAPSRYIVVVRGGVEVSRNLTVEDAIEAAYAHALKTGDGEYRIRYPERVLKAYGILNPGSDTEAPTQPQSLFADAQSATTINLYWAASTDNVGVEGYQIWRDGVPITTTANTFYTDSGLTPSTLYSYTVSAYDAAGNGSAQSTADTATTLANAAPVWSIGAQALTTSVAYNISLLDYCTDADFDPLAFSTVSGSFPPGISANYTTKTIGGTPTTVGNYSVVVRASDGITYTDQTISFEVLNADTTAPSVPTDLAGVGEGGERIDLTWTASSDTTVANARTSGLAGYKVYRDGSLRATLGAVTTYADTTVAADTGYSYTISAFDAAGNESAQTAAVVVSTSAFGWTIANTPYTVPGTWLSLTADQEYDVSVHANTTSGSPVWSITTQSKNGIAGSYGFTIDALGVVAVPANLPDPASVSTPDQYTVVVDLADATLADAESDWLARSTASGVVWAHDFRSAAEVENFIDVDPSVTTTVYDPTPAFTGGTVDHVIPGNVPSTISSITSLGANSLRVVTTSPLDLTTSDTVRFFNLPAPWDGFNDSLNGGSGLVESWTVTAVNSATSFDLSAVSFRTDLWPSINTTGFSAYSGPTSATAQRCRNSRGSWNRPMSALLAGGNGLTSNDPGIANLGMPGRTWDPVYNANRHYRYRADWYGHADYAARIATWPDWSGASQSDQYRGSDFWVQWRIKISASRYQASAAAIRNSSGLKYFAMWATGPSTPLHEIVWSDYNTPNAPYANYAASDGGIVSGYTGAGYSLAFNDGGSSMQGGGDFASTCVWTGNYPASPTACFNIVPDEWYVFLLHVIPGKQVSNWSGWPNSADATLGTGIQLWGASQSRIDAMVAAGQRATYQKIYDKVGSTAFPFQYDNWNPSAYNSANPPPAWNNVMFWTYQNNLPQAYGWTRKLTQVIFKKGNGAQNQTLSVGSVNPETDGIPCPQV